MFASRRLAPLRLSRVLHGVATLVFYANARRIHGYAVDVPIRHVLAVGFAGFERLHWHMAAILSERQPLIGAFFGATWAVTTRPKSLIAHLTSAVEMRYQVQQESAYTVDPVHAAHLDEICVVQSRPALRA